MSAKSWVILMRKWQPLGCDSSLNKGEYQNMKNDEKIFFLYTLIALLAGIIGFWIIAPAMESGAIQYISFGAIIVSIAIFISAVIKKAKQK